MEKKAFTIAMILLLSLSILAVLQIGIVKADTNIDLPDAELLNDFNQGWGPSGYTVVKTDETDPGVRFTYTGLDTGSAIATHDGYWGSNSQAPTTGICLLAGGLLNSHGYYDDFHTYTYYRLLFTNVGTSDLSVDLYMNTGYASSDPTRDTWYESDYTDIKAGERRIVTLDFSSAKVDNAGDDPDYTHYPRFTLGVPMVRLDEVTGIGFQVLKKTGDGTGALVVSAVGSSTWMHMDPSTTKKTYTVVESFFDVFVDIENVNDLFGFDLKVTWDSSLLELTEHDYDTYLQTIWNDIDHTMDYGVTTPPTDFSTPGMCRLVATSYYTSFTGASAHLLKLHFKILNPLTNSVMQIPLHFEIDKLSHKDSGTITHACADGRYVVWGLKPILSTKTTDGIGHTRTCMIYDEEFNVKLIVSDAASVTDFVFEVHYNKDQLSYHDVVWDAWGGGTIDNDAISGIITGSTPVTPPGAAKDGTQTLVTIIFHSIVKRMWKNIPSWTNDVTSEILIQKAELTYSSLPKLTYDRGDTLDPDEITIGTNFGYTFSPIKGDVNDNDGTVDIDDLVPVALKYDKNDDIYNLVGSDNLVDIFDLVVVASNFWYVYPYPGA